MVRAIREGRKTQTRRLTQKRSGMIRSVCPYGAPGDRLWVRETWAAHWMYNDVPPSQCRSSHPGDNYWYRADGDDAPSNLGHPPRGLRGKWRPAIFIPRWACRLFLEVTAVRREPLREITEADARAEGHTTEVMPCTVNGEPATIAIFDPVKWYQVLWDTINGERAPWSSNPFVWVVTFKVVR